MTSSLQFFQNPDLVEAGIDEVARGCLFGRVYAAAVIWNKDITELPKGIRITDSKKLTPKMREKASEFIKENAIAFGIEYRDEKYIDEHNILNSAISAMHGAIQQLSVQPQFLLVDGTQFKPFINVSNGEQIPHTCVVKGDATYFSIACASILAKVEHDKYIRELCAEYPELEQRYSLLSNMGYCTSKHSNGIKEFGVSPYHRMSFAPCNQYVVTPSSTTTTTETSETLEKSEKLENNININ